MNTPSAKELLKHIEDKIEHGKFIDSVHKIKLMTSLSTSIFYILTGWTCAINIYKFLQIYTYI